MPQDFFSPGLPTQYERPGASVSSRQKLGVKVENPSLDALRAEYANEPSTDQLLDAAKLSLAHASGNDTYAGMQREQNPGNIRVRGPESAEMNAPEHYGYKDVAEETAGALGFLPGPAGVAGRGASGLMGLYDMYHEGPNLRNSLQTASPLLDIIPAMRGAKGAAAGAPRALGSAEVAGSQYASKGSQIPSVQHYWDALDLGVDPAKAAKIASGGDKASMSALRSLQNSGKGAEVDLGGELTGLADSPLTPQEIAGSRASERFGGKTYRSETGNPGGPARSMPTKGFESAKASFFPSEEAGINTLDDSLTRTYGENYNPTDLPFHAGKRGTYPESKASVAAIQSPARKAGLDALTAEDKLKLREAGKLSSMDWDMLKHHATLSSDSPRTSQDALAEIERQRILFGGIGGRDEANKFIRPGDRTPISKAEWLNPLIGSLDDIALGASRAFRPKANTPTGNEYFNHSKLSGRK